MSFCALRVDRFFAHDTPPSKGVKEVKYNHALVTNQGTSCFRHNYEKLAPLPDAVPAQDN